MVLRACEVDMFERLRSLFKWIPWQLPIQWDSEYTRLRLETRKWKWLPFCITTQCMFAIGLLSIFVIIFRSSLSFQVSTPQIVILGIVFAFTSLFTVCVVLPILYESLMFGMNELFGVCDRVLDCKFYSYKIQFHHFSCLEAVLTLICLRSSKPRTNEPSGQNNLRMGVCFAVCSCGYPNGVHCFGLRRPLCYIGPIRSYKCMLSE